MVGGSDGSQAITDVVVPQQPPLHHPNSLPLPQHLKTAAVALLQLGLPPNRGPQILGGTPTPHLQHLFEGRVALRQYDLTPPRHGADQMVKLALYSRQIGKDVRVIILKVIQHQGLGLVVDKLAALIKKGGIVLISLHHKEWLLPQMGRHPSPSRNTTNQEPRRETTLFK